LACDDGGVPARRLLVVTAVAAEAEAVGRSIGSANGVTVLAGGVGAPAAAAAAAAELARAAARGDSYRCVISAGIAGGFADRRRSVPRFWPPPPSPLTSGPSRPTVFSASPISGLDSPLWIVMASC
jgi:hypothetical protein